MDAVSLLYIFVDSKGFEHVK